MNMCSVGVERCCHTGTNMSGNACLLPIIAKQRDCTDLLGCSSETNNSMRNMSSTLLVFIQYTLSGNNNFHKTILKKTKMWNSLSRECVQTSKSRRRGDISRKGCRKCYKLQERSIFFQSSRYPNNSVTDNTDQEKKNKKKIPKQNIHSLL